MAFFTQALVFYVQESNRLRVVDLSSPTKEVLTLAGGGAGGFQVWTSCFDVQCIMFNASSA